MTFRLMHGTFVFFLVFMAHANASIETVPGILQPGDQYRLAFVTSGRMRATSSSIDDYNSFVSSAANAVTELASLGATWKVIGSTETMDARDNTQTNPSMNGVGVPIFLLDGATKIADNNSDLWDEALDAALDISETGSSVVSLTVGTGSRKDGTADPVHYLGAASYISGRAGVADSDWIRYQVVPSQSFFLSDYYALSDILTVPSVGGTVPEPTTLIVWSLLGLIGTYCGRRRSGERGKPNHNPS